MASVMQSLEPFLKKTVMYPFVIPPLRAVEYSNPAIRRLPLRSLLHSARLDFAGIFQLMVLRALRLLASPIGRNISVAIVLPTALGPNLAEL